MPIKRRRASPFAIMGMTDPGGLQDAVAAHVGRIQGAASSNISRLQESAAGHVGGAQANVAASVGGLQQAAAGRVMGMQETVEAHVGGLQNAVAGHIRELQENVRRLQAALDARVAPQVVAPVSVRPPTRVPRFIAGQGIALIQRKDFVQIDAKIDPYGLLYEITAVDTVAVTCTVRRVWQDGSLSESSAITGVLYQGGLPVAVGDQGEVVRLADGKLAFVRDYEWLWQVTAVGETTCTVQMVDAAGNPVVATELTGVLFDTAPSVGDNVLLCRRTSGVLGIFQGFPWRSFAGYDVAKTQALFHIAGVLTWVDTGVC